MLPTAQNRTRDKKRFGSKRKTLWDWLQLLIIPIVLIGGGYLYGTWQHAIDQDQQQATTLQTYIDNIQDLLLKYNLQNPSSGDEVQELAQVRTQIALRGLDPQRKGILLQFLYDAHLIGFSDPSTNKLNSAIIDLGGEGNNIDLSGTILENAFMPGVDLSFTNLRGANLSGVFFNGGNLIGTHLESAKLIGVVLWDAKFKPYLHGTNMENAQLEGADLYGTDLSEADLKGALLDCYRYSPDLPDLPSRCTDLRRTYITQQQLDQAGSCKGTLLPKGILCHQP
jgi:uncharacterized protein YjbI with pentapeptide repeats